MRAGGKVLETIDCEHAIWINTEEPLLGDKTAVYVERTLESRSISPGDMIFWIGVDAFWTPNKEPFKDRHLRRIGLIGVPRPVVG